MNLQQFLSFFFWLTWISECDFRLMELTSISNSTPSLVTVSLGRTAYLECQVYSAQERKLAWIRTDDLAILAIDQEVFTRDKRFQVVHANDMWVLRIGDARMEDDGNYECHLGVRANREPIVRRIRLVVKDSVAFIRGSPSSFVQEGSSMRLECGVRDISSMPLHVFWYHNDFVLGHDRRVHIANFRDNVAREQKESLVSIVSVRNVQNEDAGVYTCAPSNARHATIFVHVQKGPHWALKQGKGVERSRQLESNKSTTMNTLLNSPSLLLVIHITRIWN